MLAFARLLVVSFAALAAFAAAAVAQTAPRYGSGGYDACFPEDAPAGAPSAPPAKPEFKQGEWRIRDGLGPDGQVELVGRDGERINTRVARVASPLLVFELPSSPYRSQGGVDKPAAAREEMRWRGGQNGRIELSAVGLYGTTFNRADVARNAQDLAVGALTAAIAPHPVDPKKVEGSGWFEARNLVALEVRGLPGHGDHRAARVWVFFGNVGAVVLVPRIPEGATADEVHELYGFTDGFRFREGLDYAGTFKPEQADFTVAVPSGYAVANWLGDDAASTAVVKAAGCSGQPNNRANFRRLNAPERGAERIAWHWVIDAAPPAPAAAATALAASLAAVPPTEAAVTAQPTAGADGVVRAALRDKNGGEIALRVLHKGPRRFCVVGRSYAGPAAIDRLENALKRFMRP